MKESDEANEAVRGLEQTMKNWEPLQNAIQSGEKIEQHPPARLPVVDQALELANLMSTYNAPNEISGVLGVAAKVFQQYSMPVYIIKGAIK